MPPELALANWRKSSYSYGQDNDCVEVTNQLPGEVPIRDSKATQRPAITVRNAPWATFLTALATNTELLPS
ncbi:DUF397 domain-containing protein [Streptomyces sp. AV19]|uniref:DUF397 domain-containing protein n=1 Tax=Streptomyces sp. AV19 TaxID=2793068 RepID=UPI0018FEFE1C|nr:DUF397 domain-containing protein [Streptomyces sp. AV19]MBH1933442.1 DUF397 domain-containing protein [Streptomyces sp. AV19]MDG4532091.1 DUF397 domain-containing protein [Streptomyces sp. AV19]